jgi:hypothetical protein
MLTLARDFLVNMAAGVVGELSSPSGMMGYLVGLGFIIYGVIGWHRKRIAGGKRGVDSWYFIAFAFLVAVIAVGGAAFGIGLRSTAPSHIAEVHDPKIAALQSQVDSLTTQLNAERQSKPSVPTSSKPNADETPLFRQDRDRMNEALVKIHGIIKTKLIGSIDQFHGGNDGVQAFVFPWNSPNGGYAGILDKMKQRSLEIESDENEIDAVLKDKDYAYLNDDLRQVVTPSGYNVPGADTDLHRDMRDFLSSLEVISQKFPKPDGAINSILAIQGRKLEPQLFNYTAWAKETVLKIEAKQKKLRQP